MSKIINWCKIKLDRVSKVAVNNKFLFEINSYLRQHTKDFKYKFNWIILRLQYHGIVPNNYIFQIAQNKFI